MRSIFGSALRRLRRLRPAALARSRQVAWKIGAFQEFVHSQGTCGDYGRQVCPDAGLRGGNIHAAGLRAGLRGFSGFQRGGKRRGSHFCKVSADQVSWKKMKSLDSCLV